MSTQQNNSDHLDKLLGEGAVASPANGNALTALRLLVALKDHKDKFGKDGYYRLHVAAAWDSARDALAVLQPNDAVIDAAIEAYDAAWNPANRGHDNKANAILAAYNAIRFGMQPTGTVERDLDCSAPTSEQPREVLIQRLEACQRILADERAEMGRSFDLMAKALKEIAECVWYSEDQCAELAVEMQKIASVALTGIDQSGINPDSPPAK